MLQNIDIFDKFKVFVPTHSFCSSLGTSSPHLIQLSSSTSIESLGHVQNKGFADVGSLLPGQTPKKEIRCIIAAITAYITSGFRNNKCVH